MSQSMILKSSYASSGSNRGGYEYEYEFKTSLSGSSVVSMSSSLSGIISSMGENTKIKVYGYGINLI